MLPPRLHGIDYNEILKFRDAYKRLGRKIQDRLKVGWVGDYHRHQRDVKCPFKAVDELAERLVYEAMIGVMDHRRIRDHNWYRGHRRDAGHQERMRRLVRTILKSREALEYSRCFRWLRIERAYY